MRNLFSYRVTRMVGIFVVMMLNVGCVRAATRPLLATMTQAKISAAAAEVAISEIQQGKDSAGKFRASPSDPSSSCCDQIFSYLDVIDSKVSCPGGSLCSDIDCLKRNICGDPCSLLKDRIRRIECMLCRLECVRQNICEGNGCSSGPAEALLKDRIKSIQTIVCEIDLQLDECCRNLNSKVDILLESPQKLTTLESKVDVVNSKVTVLETELASCCESTELNFSKVLSAIDGVESTVEKIAVETDVIFSIVSIIDSKVDELAVSFQATWTILEGLTSSTDAIGQKSDIVDQDDLDAVLDVNVTSTFSVIQWLKAIYYKVK
jgi:hypothetical protein